MLSSVTKYQQNGDDEHLCPGKACTPVLLASTDTEDILRSRALLEDACICHKMSARSMCD